MSEGLREALRGAIDELDEHGREYQHRTPPELLERWRRLAEEPSPSPDDERTAARILVTLVRGGEFAAWLRGANPEVPSAAARELGEAERFVDDLLERQRTPSSDGA